MTHRWALDKTGTPPVFNGEREEFETWSVKFRAFMAIRDEHYVTIFDTTKDVTTVFDDQRFRDIVQGGAALTDAGADQQSRL